MIIYLGKWSLSGMRFFSLWEGELTVVELFPSGQTFLSKTCLPGWSGEGDMDGDFGGVHMGGTPRSGVPLVILMRQISIFLS